MDDCITLSLSGSVVRYQPLLHKTDCKFGECLLPRSILNAENFLRALVNNIVLSSPHFDHLVRLLIPHSNQTHHTVGSLCGSNRVPIFVELICKSLAHLDHPHRLFMQNESLALGFIPLESTNVSFRHISHVNHSERYLGELGNFAGHNFGEDFA